MKKIIFLILAIVGLSALGWYTKKLISGDGHSDSELIEFAVKDTNKVDRIIISDAFSNRFEIVRKGKEWTDAKGGCITQSSVSLILDAFAKITLKGYLPEKSQQKFVDLMSTSFTKVEIFEEGEWTKTWYIGPAAQDHLGQIMLLETAEDGKSDFPVMMSVSGMYGVIEPRFFADPRKWICTNIFSLDMDEIVSVDVKFPKEKHRSFNIQQVGSKIKVTQNGKKLSTIDTSNVFRYLQNYRKIHFDNANYELKANQVDSMKKTTPFCVLTVKETKGKVHKLRMFKIPTEEPQRNEFGDLENMDMNKFWCQLPSGELVKCQYFTFNPLILGHVYFPAMEESFPKIK
jgi:hypothetical protein